MEDFWMERRYNSGAYQLRHHYEHSYQIVFLLSGKIRYYVNDKQYIVEKGGMILLNTLEDHSLEVLEYPYERFVVQINPSFFRSEVKYPEIISVFIKRPANFSHLFCISQPVWNYLYDILTEMEQEYRGKREYWQMLIGSDLRRMFITIYRECSVNFVSLRVDSGAEIAYKAVNYLDHHYTEDLSVESVSEALFLNKHYLSHVFKAETGYSPMEYVISMRINHAKALLADTNRSVSEIAVECGYTDFNHFSKLFRKHTGTSPSAFRKKAGLPEEKE